MSGVHGLGAAQLLTVSHEVTGASQGFGRAVTNLVLSRGHRVIAAMRNPGGLSDMTKRYPQEQLLVLRMDVTDQDDVDAAFERVKETFGRIDVVFNNAGVHIQGELEAIPMDAGRRHFEVDILSVYLSSDRILNLFYKTNFWGAIRVSIAAIAFFRDVNSPQGGFLIQNSSIRGRQVRR